MKIQLFKFGKATTFAVGALASVAFGIAVADHFTVNNVPPGWTSTTTAGQMVCYNGCSANVVACDAPGKHGTQMMGGSITYHPKGKGGMNNPHVFTVQTQAGPKLGPNGEPCPNEDTGGKKK